MGRVSVGVRGVVIGIIMVGIGGAWAAAGAQQEANSNAPPKRGRALVGWALTSHGAGVVIHKNLDTGGFGYQPILPDDLFQAASWRELFEKVASTCRSQHEWVTQLNPELRISLIEDRDGLQLRWGDDVHELEMVPPSQWFPAKVVRDVLDPPDPATSVSRRVVERIIVPRDKRSTGAAEAKPTGPVRLTAIGYDPDRSQVHFIITAERDKVAQSYVYSLAESALPNDVRAFLAARNPAADQTVDNAPAGPKTASDAIPVMWGKGELVRFDAAASGLMFVSDSLVGYDLLPFPDQWKTGAHHPAVMARSAAIVMPGPDETGVLGRFRSITYDKQGRVIASVPLRMEAEWDALLEIPDCYLVMYHGEDGQIRYRCDQSQNGCPNPPCSFITIQDGNGNDVQTCDCIGPSGGT